MNVLNCQITIHDRIENWKHIFPQLITDHSEVYGNERANVGLRRFALLLSCVHYFKIVQWAFYSMKRIINTKMKLSRTNLYKTTLSAKSWSSLLDSCLQHHLPGDVGIAFFLCVHWFGGSLEERITDTDTFISHSTGKFTFSSIVCGFWGDLICIHVLTFLSLLFLPILFLILISEHKRLTVVATVWHREK